MAHHNRGFWVVMFALGGLLSAWMIFPAVARAETTAIDQATPLVADGVDSYTLNQPKVFWHTGVPQCPPHAGVSDGPPPGQPGERAVPSAAEIASADQTHTELIRRIASYGSTTRVLYAEERPCSGQEILSAIAADADHVYWLGSEGLMRLSTDANPGDAPELVHATPKAPGELVVTEDRIYLIHHNTGGDNTKIAYVAKSDHQYVELHTPNNTASNLQATSSLIFFRRGDNMLIRQNPDTGVGTGIATAVTGYYAEGRRLLFCNINTGQCTFSNRVYVAMGRHIHIYDIDTNTLDTTPIYTSGIGNASIYALVTNFSQLFFFERRPGTCTPEPCIPPSGYVLMRRGRGSGGGTDAIFNAGAAIFSGPDTLRTNGSHLFFRHEGEIWHLPSDAAALPVVNMWITDVEVTQGIQSLNNSVGLVKNRRTFVRVHVRSEGVAVSNVAARLSAPDLTWNPLQPVNPVGLLLTVRPNPNRNDMNQSFLFELPWGWTQHDNLNLVAHINPYQAHLEPNYNDNVQNVNVAFNNSPTISAEFFRLNYTIGDETFRPRITEDVLATYSFIQRLYPVGGAIGDKFKPRLWDVDGGALLGLWVAQAHPNCFFIYPDADDRSLCASYFTNGWLNYYRFATLFGALNVGLNPFAFYYGMISDESGNFPRGQAIYARSSVGPTGTPCTPFGLGCGWDTDGTYADWYAAHEIGHSLGRAHPNAGSDNPATANTVENCGHSRSDPGFPYGNLTTSAAPIGPGNGSIAGFDVGDPAFGIAPAVLPSNMWNDVMSYCNNQWLSDYTYEGIYNYMLANPSSVEIAGQYATGIAGDFLFVSGVINPDADAAGFNFLRRVDNVVELPPLTPGDYTIRLVDGDGSELASHAFTPEEQEDIEGGLGFFQIVDFAAGTRGVQIVRLADSQILADAPVSVNAPTVDDVNLQDAPSPVDGVVTLAWTAEDPDNDALSYEVAYSPDDGDSFQPVAVNITQTSAQIDTAQLGGSNTAIFRVAASDGVNQGFADSPAFVMSNKAPQPFILSPADETVIHWGQLVNFSGLALDAQDSLVADDGLVWKNAHGDVLGSGALISRDDLPVGENIISLEATNSVGESAAVTVTVIVIDDLSLLGPTLSVGPTRVAWHVNPDETALQTAELILNNAGSGALDWTVASDQPWLQLSAEAGTVTAEGDAAALTLSADPTSLAPHVTHAAQVTITTAAQTVVVPVGLSIGDVRTISFVVEPEEPSGQNIYLPILQR